MLNLSPFFIEIPNNEQFFKYKLDGGRAICQIRLTLLASVVVRGSNSTLDWIRLKPCKL